MRAHGGDLETRLGSPGVRIVPPVQDWDVPIRAGRVALPQHRLYIVKAGGYQGGEQLGRATDIPERVGRDQGANVRQPLWRSDGGVRGPLGSRRCGLRGTSRQAQLRLGRSNVQRWQRHADGLFFSTAVAYGLMALVLIAGRIGEAW